MSDRPHDSASRGIGNATDTIQGLFEQQARNAPQRVAVLSDATSEPYEALERKANQVATALQQSGVPPRTVVALQVEPITDLLVLMLGVLKAGGAYCVVESTRSASWLRYVLRYCSAAVSAKPKLEGVTVPWLPASELLADRSCQPRTAPPDIDGADWCAVFHTSGTSGTPNLVPVTHRAALTRLHWMWERYPFVPDDVMLVHRTPTAIGMLWDVWGGLAGGATIAVSDGSRRGDSDEVVAACARHHVTRLSATPSLWSVLIDRARARPGTMSSLRLAISAGEPLSGALARRWSSAFPGARLLNVYGATEINTPLAYEVPPDVDDGSMVPVGTQIAGATIRIVDDSDAEVDDGQTGELMVGGPSVGSGYLNAPDLTAERYISGPETRKGAGPLFRTGDVAVRRQGGAVEIVGRKDDRIKFHGFRFDPSEVEAALLSCPGVKAGVVTVQGDGDGQLTAFVVGGSVGELRASLRAKLPTHMVPALYIPVRSIPLTPRGKVDRQRLNQLWKRARASAVANTAEATTTIERTLANVVKRIIGVTRVDLDASFEDQGGDSLSAMRVSAALETEYGLRLSQWDLIDAESLRQLATKVQLIATTQLHEQESEPS